MIQASQVVEKPHSAALVRRICWAAAIISGQVAGGLLGSSPALRNTSLL